MGLLQKLEFVWIQHLHRERNITADVIAKHSTTNALAQMVQFNLDGIVGLARPRNFCCTHSGTFSPHLTVGFLIYNTVISNF